MELLRCGMFELILVWQQSVAVLVQFYAWSMMTPLGSWLLLAETRMYKNTCNAPVDYKIRFMACLLEIQLMDPLHCQDSKHLGHPRW